MIWTPNEVNIFSSDGTDNQFVCTGKFYTANASEAITMFFKLANVASFCNEHNADSVWADLKIKD